MLVAAGCLLPMVLVGACTAPTESSRQAFAQTSEAGDVGAISRRRAMGFASRFLDWWQFHPDRAEEAAGGLPTRQLFPGHFIVSWSDPVRAGKQWKISALAVKRGRPLALRELTLVLTKSPDGGIAAKAFAEAPEEFAGLNEMVGLLDKYIEVPIVLPAVGQARFDPESSSVRLGPPGPQGFLAWGWEDGRRLLVTYGTASLSNCGGGIPERVRIGRVTGLAVERTYNTSVIWPAGQRLPKASYGLSGDWSLDRLVGWATRMESKITAALVAAPLSGC
jgi:hypothetical protein